MSEASGGIKFLELRLRNLLFYEDQSFDLGSPGIKLILGNNLTSSNDNPNGAGKSLFFSQLPELLANEQMHGSRRDLTREGSITLKLEKAGHRYLVKRSFSPKEKIIIKRDGVELEYRELEEARHAIRKLVPYSISEIKSLLFLDSQLPHPLITGDTAERKNFFTSFFKLSSLDLVRKQIKARLSDLRVDEAKLESYYDQARAAKAAIDPEHEGSAQRLEDLLANKKLMQLQLQYWSLAESLRSRRALLKPARELIEQQALTVDSAEGFVEKLQQRKSKLQAHQVAWAKHEAWTSFSKDSEDASSQLAELGYSSKELAREFVTKAAARILVLSKELSALEDSIQEAAQASKSISQKIRTAQDRKVDLLAKKKTLSQGLDTCPTCGAKYDNKHAKLELSKVAESIATCDQELKILEKTKAKLASTEDLENQAETLDKKLTAMKSKLSKVKSCLSTIDSLQVEPDKPNRSRGELAEMLEECSSSLALMSDWQSVFSVEDDWARLPAKMKTLDGFKETQETFLQCNEECLSLSVSVQRSTDAIQALAALKGKVKEVKARVKDLPSLQLLESAFSKKGVESVMIKNLASSLETQVNRYAKLIFPEDFKFSFELDTQFSILVSRKYGKKEVTSDVRKLSGAEKKLFAIVLMISLLTFVPASRRSNLLILDEPTAAMGAENLARFVRFLPVLQTVIPTIVVITPLDPKDYSSITPQTFVVTKDRTGKSTIERKEL